MAQGKCTRPRDVAIARPCLSCAGSGDSQGRDALLGVATMDAHETSRRQAAMADRVVLTKTDMAGAQTHAVSQRINALNPRVQIHQAVRGAIAPDILLAGSRGDTLRDADVAHEHHSHTSDISSFCIVHDTQIGRAHV